MYKAVISILLLGVITFGYGGVCDFVKEDNIAGSSAPLPSAVTNLQVSQGNTTRGVTLTWQDNSNNEDGFKVERSNNNATFSEVITVSPNVTSYQDTGLNNGVTYYYRIKAFNTHGDSMYSNTAQVTVIPTPSWTLKTPVNNPSFREYHAMSYDSARGKVILFGGSAYSAVHNDETWEWDETNWTLMTPTNKPSARIWHAMTYDSNRGKVVLFGGRMSSGLDSDETWEWDGTNWSLMTPINKPLGRCAHAMAYDSNRNKVVLFGGSTSGASVNFDETWEWDGTNWTLMTPTNKPSARQFHAMAYDSARDKVVLFGGSIPSSPSFLKTDETWEWDGANWTLMSPLHKPLPRSAPVIYNPDIGKVILFGGFVGASAQKADETWEWDGTDWTQRFLSNKPSARGAHAMTYDQVRHRIVLYGGEGESVYNDTWEYEY